MNNELKMLDTVQDSLNPIQVIHYGSITAGFPSPVKSSVEENIDFNQYLRPNPISTYSFRVSGDSMIEANIPDRSLLIVDRSIVPVNNNIVVAVVNGDFTVKYFIKNRSGIRLMPANAKYQPIPITDDMEFSIWGTVTRVIIETLKF
ncbi:MAG TPA: translesion error-prone DNA polymerase V autoproteolytic subunit [Ferruginibacter sp.]|nr:translesion error-prone DNA polymerase V autoproteolytic subunit [Ferruginibacter sp.]